MPTIVLVDTNGNLKEVKLKSVSDEELMKKYGLKLSDMKHNWNVTVSKKIYNISLYAKTSGRAGQENKYEFPPPIDSDLYFGKCALINSTGNISIIEWGAIYENLYGGFDDIGANDSDEEEDDYPDDASLTKTGYMKDDFVVDDEDDEEEEEDEEEPEEEEVQSSDDDSSKVILKKQKGKTKVKNVIKPKATRNKGDETLEHSYLDCTLELTEEDYI